MDSKLNQFVNTYTGILCGDTPQNKGQCVGLSELWMDELGLNNPHEYGNACDLLTNANTNNFDVIYNTPSGFPFKGDVMVWGKSWGAGYGHTGVIVTADINSFNCFEQNNPEGHAPQINGHSNYNGVLGWLHPHWNPPVVVPPPLTGLSVEVGYNPTFEGQDVMVNGVHYHSTDGKTWEIVEPTPPVEIPPVVETPPTVITVPSEPVVVVPQPTTGNTQPTPLPTVSGNTKPKLSFWQKFLNYLKKWTNKQK